MVFEDLLSKIGKRRPYSVLLGVLYVLISYGTAKVFFAAHISIAMIFFITLLLVPSTARLITFEERIERKEGLRHFFKNHNILMEVFLFLFIGIFIGYLIIGTYTTTAMTYQKTFLADRGIVGNIVNEKIEKITQFTGIIINNISVIVVAFVLSLLYGVGALFLIVLNASVFASFVIQFSDLVAQQTALNAALFSLHFIPEVFGFLLAAIAGGVISKAIVKERVGTGPFQNVVKDATVLLLLSIAVILLAALLEAFGTPFLIKQVI